MACCGSAVRVRGCRCGCRLATGIRGGYVPGAVAELLLRHLAPGPLPKPAVGNRSALKTFALPSPVVNPDVTGALAACSARSAPVLRLLLRRFLRLWLLAAGGSTERRRLLLNSRCAIRIWPWCAQEQLPLARLRCRVIRIAAGAQHAARAIVV
jgi:hypothetical protein